MDAIRAWWGSLDPALQSAVLASRDRPLPPEVIASLISDRGLVDSGVVKMTRWGWNETRIGYSYYLPVGVEEFLEQLA